MKISLLAGPRHAAILAVLLVTACGYRGPLYLPEDEPTAPEAQEEAGAGPAAAADDEADEDDKDDDEDRDQLR